MTVEKVFRFSGPMEFDMKELFKQAQQLQERIKEIQEQLWRKGT